MSLMRNKDLFDWIGCSPILNNSHGLSLVSGNQHKHKFSDSKRSIYRKELCALDKIECYGVEGVVLVVSTSGALGTEGYPMVTWIRHIGRSSSQNACSGMQNTNELKIGDPHSDMWIQYILGFPAKLVKERCSSF